jgi:hypothetical protein
MEIKHGKMSYKEKWGIKFYIPHMKKEIVDFSKFES